MKLLIIEDDKNKLAQVRSYVKREFPGSVLEEACSYREGLKRLLGSPYHLVILDMSLPTFDVTAVEPGYRFRQFAGQEILAAMKDASVVCPVVVLTQFPSFGEGDGRRSLQELDAELRRDFPPNYLGYISYSHSEAEWKSRLNDIISKLGGAR